MKTELGTYTHATWTGTNTSGWKPVGDRVLVLPDEASALIGLVHVPDDVRDRSTLASEAGVLIEAGEGAFVWNSDRVTPFAGYKPQPGDRVHIHRYSGQIVVGKDGVKYRIMDSQEVGAVAEKGAK